MNRLTWFPVPSPRLWVRRSPLFCPPLPPVCPYSETHGPWSSWDTVRNWDPPRSTGVGPAGSTRSSFSATRRSPTVGGWFPRSSRPVLLHGVPWTVLLLWYFLTGTSSPSCTVWVSRWLNIRGHSVDPPEGPCGLLPSLLEVSTVLMCTRKPDRSLIGPNPCNAMIIPVVTEMVSFLSLLLTFLLFFSSPLFLLPLSLSSILPPSVLSPPLFWGGRTVSVGTRGSRRGTFVHGFSKLKRRKESWSRFLRNYSNK